MEEARPPLLTGVRTTESRRRDTVVIDYTAPLRSQTGQADEPRESLPVSAGMSIVESYEEALMKFDNGSYDDACSQFRSIAETLPPDDSLAYEARFMEAECAITANKPVIGLSTLIALSLDKSTPEAVLEKVLIRKGQTQCLLGEYESAANSFEQFRERFPDSIYLPLANCESAR